MTETSKTQLVDSPWLLLGVLAVCIAGYMTWNALVVRPRLIHERGLEASQAALAQAAADKASPFESRYVSAPLTSQSDMFEEPQILLIRDRISGCVYFKTGGSSKNLEPVMNKEKQAVCGEEGAIYFKGNAS